MMTIFEIALSVLICLVVFMLICTALVVAFNEIENKLVAAGCEVVNPRITSRWGLSWETYMQIAQAILYSGEIDVVVLLKGWEQSRGACIERVWAEAKGIQILEVGKP